MEKEQKMYEIGYLLSPLLAEEKLEEEVLGIRKAIEDKQGFVISEARPKNQKLSYSVKIPGSPAGGFGTAFFGWIKFLVDPDGLTEINAFLKSPLVSSANKLIRFLITGVKKETMSPKPERAVRKRRVPAEGLAGKEKTEIKIEEVDKKLEELLGK